MYKISNEELACLQLFYGVTGVDSTLCLIKDNGVAFVVPEGKMGQAIGKRASNVKLLSNKLGKNVYIFEKSGDEVIFLKKSLNVKSPIITESMKNNKKVIYVKLNTSDKLTMRRGAVLSFVRELFDRIYDKELKIQLR